MLSALFPLLGSQLELLVELLAPQTIRELLWDISSLEPERRKHLYHGPP